MPRTLIIGYGNTTRGDDGIGCVAAERLAKELREPDVRVLILQQMALELAAEFSQVDRVILIDAARASPAGRVCVERLSPAASKAEPFSHELSPASLLECTRALYGRYPETWLVSVAGESFAFGDQLSVPVTAALPEVRARVHELVAAQVHPPAISA
jgi:hydrogenase maturation protease